jgi:hypothetical protein
VRNVSTVKRLKTTTHLAERAIHRRLHLNIPYALVAGTLEEVELVLLVIVANSAVEPALALVEAVDAHRIAFYRGNLHSSHRDKQQQASAQRGGTGI